MIKKQIRLSLIGLLVFTKLYGVTFGNEYILYSSKIAKYYKRIDIIYYGKKIKTYYIVLRK